MAEVGTVDPAYHSRILICSDPLELQSNLYALNKENALAEGSAIQHRIVPFWQGRPTID